MILWVLIMVAAIVGLSLYVVLFWNNNSETSIIVRFFGEDAYLGVKLLEIAAFLLFFPIFLFEGFSWLRLLLFIIGYVPAVIAFLVLMPVILTEKRIQKFNNWLDNSKEKADAKRLRKITRIYNTFEKLDKKLDRWKEKSEKFFGKLDAKLDKFEEKFVVQSVIRIEKKINKIEQKDRIHFFDKIRLSVYKFQVNYCKPSPRISKRNTE